jgi:heterodisulfide reductase subunit C
VSLRKYIHTTTGQDVRQCQSCSTCTKRMDIDHDILDVPFESLMQLILFDDEEVLTCRSVWSEEVLSASKYACERGLDVPKILLALREEAHRRGLV